MVDNKSFSATEVSMIMRCVSFAASKHKDQRRKDSDKTPYINHPLTVAELVWNTGKLHDIDVVCAALLHDTVEDTDATFEELSSEFGERVTGFVREVTDDKSLPKDRRKELQIEHASHISTEAKHIKLADKITNVLDIHKSPPPDWTQERLFEYLDWATKVVDQVRGANKALEQHFDESVALARKSLKDR